MLGYPAMTQEDKTFTINIRDRFKYGNEQEAAMMTHVARLCVLYQDLLIEVSGAIAKKALPDLDYGRIADRQMYFLRKGLVTVWEIKQGCDVLNQNPAFKLVLRRMDPSNAKLWTEAIRYFQARGKELKEWRNNVAGHFGDAAARFAIDNMPPELTGELFVAQTEGGVTCRLAFAYQIMAIAMAKMRDPKKDFEQHFREAFQMMLASYDHSINVVTVLASEVVLGGRDGAAGATFMPSPAPPPASSS